MYILFYLGCYKGNSCCSSSNKCGEGHGDCDYDYDCKAGLVCGENNCLGSAFSSNDDCCKQQNK